MIDLLMDIKASNIENIISLWTEVSAPFNSIYNKEDYTYCYIPFSDWPNRLWSYHFTPEILDEAVKEIRNGKEKMTISYWDDNYDLFLSRGFEQKSRLLGMSLPLHEKLAYEGSLELIQAKSREQSKLWAETFPLGFRYLIHEDVIVRSLNKVQFYLAFLGETVIGTAMLYIHNGIAGIHAVGVIPDMRKKGFAEEIMKALINISVDSKASHCVLQASAMGKGIYTRLGFKEDFLFTNYMLP